MKRRVRGYTLVELLVVIGILAIFMTLFLAVVSASFRTVNAVQSRSDAQQKARIALNYIRDRLAQASSLTPGIELHDFYRDRPSSFTPNPLLQACDFNNSINWTTQGTQPPAPDNRIDAFDSAKFERVPNNFPVLHYMQDPLCLADPVPPVLIFFPGGVPYSINENPDQRYPGNRGLPGVTTLYRTELEDLNGDGNFVGIERYLRTLVFEVRSPSVPFWGPTSCLAPFGGNSGAKVERQIVTLAHTWKEKTFWQDFIRDGVIEPSELRTEDFVLYERKTRYFEDPIRNQDVNCSWPIDDADEVTRVTEVPLVTGIIDVIFQLLDERGEEILPCIGSCGPPPGLPELAGRDYNGEFICRLRTEYFNPTTGQREVNPNNLGVPFEGAPGWGACRRVHRIRVTVVAGSDSAIRTLRKSMNEYFVPFQVLDRIEPRELGALDYLGVTPYSHFYQKGSLVILQEEISLHLMGG